MLEKLTRRSERSEVENSQITSKIGVGPFDDFQNKGYYCDFYWKLDSPFVKKEKKNQDTELRITVWILVLIAFC